MSSLFATHRRQKPLLFSKILRRFCGFIFCDMVTTTAQLPQCVVVVTMSQKISRETVSLMQEANESELLLVKQVCKDPSIPLESLWVKALDSVEQWDEKAHATVTAMVKRLNAGRKLGDDTVALVLALIHHAMCVDEPIMESEGDSML